MFEPPETRYTRSGDVHIAYQYLGDGPQDVVVLSEWTSHIEAFWEYPLFARMLRRIASSSRLILFDKRGVGLSDPVSEEELASVEIWMDDLLAVLDACDSRQAVLAGTGHGGQMAVLFAATHPERTKSLLLANAYARLARAPDYPWGIPEQAQERSLSVVGAPETGTDADRVLATLLFTERRTRRLVGVRGRGLTAFEVSKATDSPATWSQHLTRRGRPSPIRSGAGPAMRTPSR